MAVFLKPKLSHHRAEFERVANRRWPVIGGAVLAAPCIVFLVPIELVMPLSAVLFFGVVVALAGIEIQLALIYRRDLLERRRSD